MRHETFVRAIEVDGVNQIIEHRDESTQFTILSFLERTAAYLLMFDSNGPTTVSFNI
jgi:hypothetical protein